MKTLTEKYKEFDKYLNEVKDLRSSLYNSSTEEIKALEEKLDSEKAKLHKSIDEKIKELEDKCPYIDEFDQQIRLFILTKTSEMGESSILLVSYQLKPIIELALKNKDSNIEIATLKDGWVEVFWKYEKYYDIDSRIYNLTLEEFYKACYE